MQRILICSIALAVVLSFAANALHSGFDSFGFGIGMAICVAFGCVFIALSFGWDYYEKRRGRSGRP